MKHGLKLGAMVVVLSLAWTIAAQAGALNLEQISGNAQWLAHVDVDAMKASPVAKSFCEDCLKDWPAVREDFKEFREKWGFSLCKDLQGITLYGTKIAPKHNVMIVKATFNKQAIVDRLTKTACLETSQHNDHTLYAWTKLKGTKYARKVAIAFFQEDTIVLASCVDLLKQALDTLDGKAPHLAGKDSPLAANVPDGAIFLARADGLQNAEVGDALSILKLFRQLNYVEGQREDRWFGELQVTAESEEVANKLKEIFQGHLAMLSLHFHDQPGAVKLIDKIQISVDGNVTHMTFEAPVQEVADQMGPFCKAMKEHWKWHMKTCKKMMYMKHMDRKMDGKMIEKMKEVMKDLMKEKMEKKDLHDHQEHEM
jgi:hypothetical protein